ncbi:MAG: neutral zinc metallopeptidase [Cyclobacteriaceae bacterium]
MRYKGRRQSSNVEDRRGKGGKIALGGGLGIIVLIVGLLLGGDPGELLQQVDMGTQTSEPYEASQEEEELAELVKVTLADTEQVWAQEFQKMGRTYKPATLVLFTNAVRSGCGNASAATGPFYCPADQKVYIDLSFYNDLKNRFGAGGDFAMAYVVAHEVGHHVQNLLGISEQVQQQRGRISQEAYNQLSVKLELQADFMSGLWAHHNDRLNNVLQDGDIEEALNAANAIGDDRLQKQSGGRVVPESFTHGTSAQRMKWFKKGYQSGDINQGDTFNASVL